MPKTNTHIDVAHRTTRYLVDRIWPVPRNGVGRQGGQAVKVEAMDGKIRVWYVGLFSCPRLSCVIVGGLYFYGFPWLGGSTRAIRSVCYS